MADASFIPTKSLESLARVQFVDLSYAELKLLNGASHGEPTSCRPEQDEASDSPPGHPSDKKDCIRADLIRWLCVDSTAKGKVDSRGIRISDAVIAGQLDLCFANVAFPLVLFECQFTSLIDLSYARVPALSLRGTTVRLLDADGLCVDGAVLLCDGFSVDLGVRLSHARIGGILNCDRGKFESLDGPALKADGIEVKGFGYFRNASITGGLHIPGARFAGSVELDGATLNSKTTAFSADNARIGGSLFLRGVTADGEVRLMGTQVQGDVECNGSTFRNISGVAFGADGIGVSGNISLCDRCSSEGKVLLVGAVIAGNLDCDGSTFKNPGGVAINADGAKLGGAFLFRGAVAEGEIRFMYSRVGGVLGCRGGTLKNIGGKALNADGITVEGNVYLHRNFSAEGQVRLRGAKIGGLLNCNGGKFRFPNGIALNASRARIDGSVSMRGTFLSEGEVRLVGARIGSSLDCDGGTFTNPNGRALNASRIRVEGNLYLRDGFTAAGEVHLFGAQIGGNLSCQRAAMSTIRLNTAAVKGVFYWSKIASPTTVRLDLRNATVGPIVDDIESWPQTGNLSVDGFTYGRIFEGPTDGKIRLGWLERSDKFTLQPYQQLAKVLRETGDVRGARWVLFTMEQQRRLRQNLSIFGRVWSWVLRVAIGYGQMPWRALGWLTVLTLVGSVFFGCGYLGGALFPSDKEAFRIFEQQHYPPNYYVPFNPVVYSFEHSFPFANFGVKEHWAPAPIATRAIPQVNKRWLVWLRDEAIGGCHPFRFQASWVMRLWLWFQVVAGWILATLFVAGLTGVVKSS